jgi:hypothetical protein
MTATRFGLTSIQNVKILPADKIKLMNEVDRWSEAEMNGRKIRKVILTAENIAASDERHPQLMPHHIDDLLNLTIEFSDYNRGNASRTKKIQWIGPSYQAFAGGNVFYIGYKISIQE